MKGWLSVLKTIREIAEITGVSKTAIYALIKSHGIPTSKDNGVLHVSDSGLSLILAHYQSSQYDTLKDILENSTNVENDSINIDSHVENNNIIKILEKQLDEKQEVIKGLLQALANEQQIRAVPLLSDKQNTFSDTPPHKKSFWSKFRKQ